MSTPSDSNSKGSAEINASTAVEPIQDRSRNAKAQARHRAKRKAYIEQLETTVTELKAALAESGSKDTDERVAALMEENAKLKEELQRLRAQADRIGSNGDEQPSKKRRVSRDDDPASYLGPAMLLTDSPRGASIGLGGANILDVPTIRAPPHIQQHHMPLNQPLSIGSLHFANQDRPASAQSNSQKARLGPSPLGIASFQNGQPQLMYARHSLPTHSPSFSSYPAVGTPSPATSAGPSPYALHQGQSPSPYDEVHFPHGLSNGLTSLTSAVRDTTLGLDMASTPQSQSSQSDAYTVRSDPPPPYISSPFPSPAFHNGQAPSFSTVPPFIGFSSAFTDDTKSDINTLPSHINSNHLFTPSHLRRTSGSSPSLTASSASSPELPGTPFSSYDSQLPTASKQHSTWPSPYNDSLSTPMSFVMGGQVSPSGHLNGSGNVLRDEWFAPVMPSQPPQQGQDA